MGGPYLHGVTRLCEQRENCGYSAKINYLFRLTARLAIRTFSTTWWTKVHRGRQARLRSGDSGNRSRQPHASAWGTGLTKEPSLQRTDGAPPSGGDPREGPRSRPMLRISVLGGPIGRDGLAGSRKDTPGCSRKLRLPGQERRFVASVRTPKGRGFGRALSGFCASGARHAARARQAPARHTEQVGQRSRRTSRSSSSLP